MPEADDPVSSWDRLHRFFDGHPRIALGFSGGTDSSFLFHAAVTLGIDVLPVFVDTRFNTRGDLEEARRLCSEKGIELTVVDVDILSVDGVADNGTDRCYRCKRSMFSAIIEAAGERGYTEVMDGTNASDPEDERPGMRAIRELGVLSPLRMCGIGKAEVRALARESGLSNWDRPTNSCLATRIPSGIPIDGDVLGLVEISEARISALGFTGFRVRTDGISARIRFPGSQVAEARCRIDELTGALSPMFSDIGIDEVTREERWTEQRSGRYSRGSRMAACPSTTPSSR